MKIGQYDVVVVSKDEVKVGCATVSRSVVKEVLRLMDEWKPTPKFEVGDFVKVDMASGLGLGKYRLHGEHGKVVTVGTEIIGVEFPKYYECGGDLGGLTKDHHGFWFEPHQLRRVD